jgi:hypothetical protein
MNCFKLAWLFTTPEKFGNYVLLNFSDWSPSLAVGTAFGTNDSGQNLLNNPYMMAQTCCDDRDLLHPKSPAITCGLAEGS